MSLPNRKVKSNIGEVFSKTKIDIADTSKAERALISLANQVSLIDVFHSVGVSFPPYAKAITCPFSSHKGGMERSPSFQYYPDTNSFYCWGCQAGGGPVDFYVNFKSISKTFAAKHLLSNFANSELNIVPSNFPEKLKLYLEFSKAIREFIILNKNYENAIEFIEKITFVYDQLNKKHDLDVKALRSLIDKLLRKIQAWQKY